MYTFDIKFFSLYILIILSVNYGKFSLGIGLVVFHFQVQLHPIQYIINLCTHAGNFSGTVFLDISHHTHNKLYEYLNQRVHNLINITIYV